MTERYEHVDAWGEHLANDLKAAVAAYDAKEAEAAKKRLKRTAKKTTSPSNSKETPK